ncbi:MAG TPA: DUF559 domain-containing protein [Bacteroidales bacterium]|mgnify:CR=1 FL=1|nr:DUF559 domain-containing protein [Bacteroidales bacterium]
MIKPIIVSPRKSLNKAFLKLKPTRTEIELFKINLSTLLDRINENESEEFHKNLVADFLKGTYYGADHFINTKGRNDLVIHSGKDAKTNVGVIIEAKSPANKTEMLKKNNINQKAFHELILYYLRERITAKNIEVKHLVASNIFEWYIFDARDFDKLFAQNKQLVKQFTDFEEKRLASTDTAFFYKEIAEKFVSSLDAEISYTYFDIRDYEMPLKNLDKKDDNILIALYKLLSPQHLLKQAFLNDSNSLDKTFYSELLHLIGLEETKEGSKKLIGRKATNKNSGSLLENAIIQLDTLDKISRISNPSQFGNNTNERLYNVSLELVITWVNRILFLKLLEAQLVSYHKGDKNYEFLNTGKIKDFDELNSLFFRVLARKPDERSEDVAKAFSTVPYLNSSLFEPTELEHQAIFISSLRDESKIPILSNTVLKDATGKKRSGELNTIEYIFEFLNAYDFSSEGSEDIQEENKTLINASVLGLIFEKINGYKDGSFFTPGFITMYMCRETIRRAVLQKFNHTFPLPGGGQGVGSSPLLGGGQGVGSSWKSKITPYRSDLPEKARKLRNNPTVSEQTLWKALKGKNQFGYDFHRQKPLDSYIADFYCRDLKLVIELDGATHLSEDVINRDKTKEQSLNDLGINVLRFPDALVINDTSQVLKQIEIYIDAFLKKNSTLYRDGCTPDLSYKTALNPLSGKGLVFGSLSNLEGLEDTPPDPLSRGGDTPPGPLSRGGEEEGRYKSLDDVYNAIGRDFTKEEANSIINSLKICDPAVGSGHFLVSALNEIIAIKSELKILCDSNGKTLRDYSIEVVNDELAITDEDGKPFEYNPNNAESRRVQETLFREKQTIIENCLFGVDINPNSVKICRLRLWIELLKNAFYKFPLLGGGQGVGSSPLPGGGKGSSPLSGWGQGVGSPELETLPNIDINIKCGNSLISRYALDSDIKAALKKSKWTVDSYRLAVMTYRNAQSKDEKREMEKLIGQIKNDFESEVAINDKRVIRLRKLKADLLNLTTQTSLFEKSKAEKADWNKQVKSLTTDIQKRETELEEIKNNKIYENAFEWRFEFPEVLNDDGDFVGFDVVIGNPPYGVSIKGQERDFLINDIGKVPDYEIYYWFINKANLILRKAGQFSFIIPNTILFNLFAENYRLAMFDNWHFEDVLDCTEIPIFTDATVRNVILLLKKDKNGDKILYRNTKDISNFFEIVGRPKLTIMKDFIENNNQNWGLLFKLDEKVLLIISKLKANSVSLNSIFTETSQGLIAYDKYKGQSEEIIKNRVYHSFEKKNNEYKPWLYGEDVTRYNIRWNGKEYINYCLGIANPRDPKYFVGKRILIREITNPQIYASITEEELYNDPAIIIIKENPAIFNLELLLGILNSKLATFYHFNSSPKASKGAFPKILVYDVNNFPLPKNIDRIIENKITILATEILTIKKATPTADTTELESEIDRLVYELYGLTEEEIKIVEGR